MKKLKNCIISIVIMALFFSFLPIGFKKAEAATRLSIKRKTISVGNATKIKIIGTKKSVKWSVSNKKIKIVTKTKKFVKIKGVLPGSSYLKAKVGNKVYKCKITIKKVKKSTGEKNSNNATKQTKSPVITLKPDVPSLVNTPIPEPDPTNTPTPIKDNINFIKGNIYNGNDCTISVHSGDNEHIKFLIENSSNKDYTFNIHSCAINGFMTDCNPYSGRTEVASGKKAFCELYFENSWTEHIERIEYIDVIFWAYDNAISFKDFETDILRISTDQYENDSSFDVSTDYQESKNIYVHLDSISNEEIIVSVVNKNNYYIDYSLENTSINGWTIDTFISVYNIELYPNSKHVFILPIEDEWLVDTDITDITEFEFNLSIRISGDHFQEEQTDKFLLKK